MNKSLKDIANRLDAADRQSLELALAKSSARSTAIASIIADWQLDIASVNATLLFSQSASGELPLSQVRQEFGETTAELVAALLELTDLEQSPVVAGDHLRRAVSSENLRKLLLVTSKDLRVIIIKLAERLCTLRTPGRQDAASLAILGRDTLEIYSPLANRLGMGQLKAEMEDLAFRYAQPDEYRHVVEKTRAATEDAETYLERFKRDLHHHLEAAGAKLVSLDGRRKHFYSIYQKLAKTDGELDKIYDLVALRLIVPEVRDCYQALGVIHQHYKPLIYRIKDYIAVPKPNGYQSLHTTVFGPEGRISEIQIRTREMHESAERGLAAHFYYDDQKSQASYRDGRVGVLPRKLGWASQLASLSDNFNDQAAADSLAIDLFSDRIFVFSPKGDIYELPEGSTPVDFAFAIHSDLGLRLAGAKINGRMVTLTTALENRDVVEIITKREPAPNRDWLTSARTTSAKSRIRAWFRAASKDSNAIAGQQALETELKGWGISRADELTKAQIAGLVDALHVRDLDQLYVAIGEGTVSSSQVVRKLFRPITEAISKPINNLAGARTHVLVAGQKLAYQTAKCCMPVYPQSIIGYVTRGSGVTVHSSACSNIPIDAERQVACTWSAGSNIQGQVRAHIKLMAADRVGLLRDISGVVASRGLSIQTYQSETDPVTSEVTATFWTEASDDAMIANLVRQLRSLPGIVDVLRVH